MPCAKSLSEACHIQVLDRPCQWADLGHEEAGLCVQKLALGPWVEQEGVTAEGERAIQAKLMLGLVMRLSPRHVVVLHIKLLTATTVCVISHCNHNICHISLHPQYVSYLTATRICVISHCNHNMCHISLQHVSGL